MFFLLFFAVLGLQSEDITVSFDETRQRGELVGCQLMIINLPIGLVSKASVSADTLTLETRYVVRGERLSLSELEFSYVLLNGEVRFAGECEGTVCTSVVEASEFLEVISSANEGVDFSLAVTPAASEADVIISTPVGDRIPIESLQSCLESIAP